MPFRDGGWLWLQDILESIDAVEMFTRSFTLKSFEEDPKTIAAVERKLQIVSEAAIRLGGEAEILCPGPPWLDIRGIGNWLRHQYDRVETEKIWDTVVRDLPPLKAAVQSAIETRQSSDTGLSNE